MIVRTSAAIAVSGEAHVDTDAAVACTCPLGRADSHDRSGGSIRHQLPDSFLYVYVDVFRW